MNTKSGLRSRLFLSQSLSVSSGGGSLLSGGRVFGQYGDHSFCRSRCRSVAQLLLLNPLILFVSKKYHYEYELF